MGKIVVKETFMTVAKFNFCKCVTYEILEKCAKVYFLQSFLLSCDRNRPIVDANPAADNF